MTATLFLYLLFFQVPGAVSDPNGKPAEGAKVACGSETKTTDPHEVPDFPRVCKTSESVVVTATRAPLAVEESGVAAEVFTAKDFEPARGAFVQNLLRDVPGLTVVQSGSNGAITSVFARGGESDAALVLLDGVPVTEPGGGLDFAHLTSPGLERMEVIRGPESVLFGAEAPSAVIQMFTERGDPEADRPHGSLSYERGSFSTDHWTAGLNGGFANRLDYAFTTDQFRSTGEFPNDAFRITSGTANVGYRFSDATQLRAVFRTFDSYAGVPGQVAYGLTNLDANEKDRDATVSVRLDDRRGARFSQHVQFGYHRYRDTFSDNVEEDYDVSAFVKVSGPKTYFAGLAPAGAPGSVPGFGDLFASSGFTFTDRTSAGYQGTVSHRGGALVFGYDYERQARLDFRRQRCARQQRSVRARAVRAGAANLCDGGRAPGAQQHVREQVHSPRRGHLPAADGNLLPVEPGPRHQGARVDRELRARIVLCGQSGVEAREDGQLRGRFVARLVREKSADRCCVFPQPVHGPDRVRFLAESGDLGEHRPELGARRGALRIGESVALRERTRELHEAVHAQFRRIWPIRNWCGVRETPALFPWSSRRGDGR